MSFTRDIKEQISRVGNSCDFCDIAELSALVKLCTSYREGEIIISTENDYVAERIRVLFRNVFFCDIEFVNRNGVLRYKPGVDFFAGEIAQRLKLFGTGEKEIAPMDCCRAAYIRGAFLGGGSMSDPKVRYHMEFDCRYEGYAEQICNILKGLDITAKITCRKNRYIAYIKEYSAIADTLGLMGAVGAAMELYNISIEKEIRNTVNRQANCELANIEKITKTASVQIEAIKKLERHMVMESLPDTLKEISRLRCEYPEESLTEIGKRLNPPIGKSGVNHRLKRIMELAKKL